ncbi:GAF domain-containing protein [Mucilaginibacter robiniae]|uniref:GAF domain-containing protein n=1 Tax=Mucilaginibacter robiniae TaxID=2728022 RepID=A0A7L5E8Q2_9SPHI|nr:GAF domain-containing protein [Mucilaginibacter robiniae]QJD97253.1 GAF domain-containing protein [Mucilaginibacter robiniae]
MPQRELERLRTVNRFLKLEISKEKELQEIVEHAAQICGASIAMITFMDEEAQYVKFKIGTQIEQLETKTSFCQHTIKQDKIFVVPNATKDTRFASNPYVVQGPQVRFYAGSPLTTQDGFNLGTLCVYDGSPKQLDPIQEQILQSLSKQVIHILEFEESLQLLKDQFVKSRLEETKLRSYFESSSSCHLLLDTQLRVISFNKALSDIMSNTYGIPFGVGMNVTDCIHPGFVEEFLRNYHKALNGESVFSDTYIESPQGSSCWSISYEPARDQQGETIGVAYNATDITEQIEQKKQLNAQNESLRQIDHIQSNELREPINSVIHLMDNIKEQDCFDTVVELMLLERTVKELKDKSNGILNFSVVST